MNPQVGHAANKRPRKRMENDTNGFLKAPETQSYRFEAYRVIPGPIKNLQGGIMVISIDLESSRKKKKTIFPQKEDRLKWLSTKCGRFCLKTLVHLV